MILKVGSNGIEEYSINFCFLMTILAPCAIYTLEKLIVVSASQEIPSVL
jgi:hypothetical protein